jgi:hypothetical protein
MNNTKSKIFSFIDDGALIFTLISVAMVFSGLILYSECDNNKLFLILSIVGATLFVLTITSRQHGLNTEIAEAKLEFIDKFGTTKPKMNVICNICHQPYEQHTHPVECPNNAFYNYKTNQYELR